MNNRLKYCVNKNNDISSLRNLGWMTSHLKNEKMYRKNISIVLDTHFVRIFKAKFV